MACAFSPAAGVSGRHLQSMLTSLATRGASASPGAASASAARDRRQAITVAGMMQKDDGDLDEDDFVGEAAGRRCFYGTRPPRRRPRSRRSAELPPPEQGRALGAEERGRAGRRRAALPRPRRRDRHHRRDVGRRLPGCARRPRPSAVARAVGGPHPSSGWKMGGAAPPTTRRARRQPLD